MQSRTRKRKDFFYVCSAFTDKLIQKTIRANSENEAIDKFYHATGHKPQIISGPFFKKNSKINSNSKKEKIKYSIKIPINSIKLSYNDQIFDAIELIQPKEHYLLLNKRIKKNNMTIHKNQLISENIKVFKEHTEEEKRHMRKVFINKMKSLLVSQKEEISKKHHDVEFDISGDETDAIQGKILAHIQAQLSSRDKQKLVQIDKALLKIKDGDFGACEECGDDISEKRLEINPSFTTCIGCAEHIELLKKKNRI